MSELIEKIKTQLSNVISQVPPDDYYPEDVDRWLNSDWQIKRFQVAARATCSTKNEDEMINATVDLILKNFKWRKDERVNEVSEKDFPEEVFRTKILGFGVAPCGRNIFYINAKLYHKFPEITKNFQDYARTIIEKLDRQLNGKRLTMFLDCSGISLSNADVSFFKYIVGLLTYQYPLSLEQTFIYSPPWYIEPLISLVINVLPAKITKNVATLNKSNALKLLGEEGVPEGAGGKLDTEICTPKGAILLDDYITRHNLSRVAVNNALRAYRLI